MVAIAIIAFVVYRSSAFTIESKSVTGAAHLTDEYVISIASVEEGSTLLRFDRRGITSRLTDDPWIADVRIKRQFPSTLVLVVTERKPIAVVDVQPVITSIEVEQWLISEDGIWLGKVDDLGEGHHFTPEEAETLVKFTDISRTAYPVVGRKTEDVGVLNAIKILDGFSDGMRALVYSISAPDRDRTTLSLINNVSVVFGAAEDIKAKEGAIITLLNEHPNTLISINVRVPHRATFSAYGD